MGVSVESSGSTWVGRLPGAEGLVRVNLSGSSGDSFDAGCSIDVPGRWAFGQALHRVVPFEPESFRRWVGSYTDGERSYVLTMNSDTDIGETFPFYVDLDAGAIVRLYPIGEDRLLSERGEELRLSALTRSEEPVEEQVSFPVPGSATVLSGTLLRPAGRGPVPGVVVAHGAGFHQRDVYRAFAAPLLRGGVAVLIYDRQGFGSSTGEPTPRLDSNAAGLEAAIDFMAGRDDISSVGLWGISNGMWTVPLVAARRDDLSFVAGMSAPGTTMAECEVHRRSGALRQGGVSQPAATVAADVWRRLFAVAISGEASQRQIDDLEELLVQLRAEPSVRSFEVPEYAVASPMLSPMPPLGPAASVVEHLVGDPDPEFGHDPIDSYREIRCPVFLQFGSEDVNLPARLSAERIRAALTGNGNKHVTVTMYEGAGHLLEVVPERIDGMTYEQASYLLHNVRFAPGAVDELVNWTAARSAARPS